MRILATLTLIVAAFAADAECVGQNLINALPSDQRAALTIAADAVPYPKGNLWTATKGSQTITLIGTYHLGDPRHDAMFARVAPDLARATALMVEAGPDEEAALKSYVASHPERLINQTGPTLPEALPKADWLRLTDALRARGIPSVFAAKLQPWYVSTLLAIPACQFDSATARNGLDQRLMDAATARALPVMALEPYDTLFTIFDSFTAQDQLTMLVQTLDAAATDEDMAITLSDSYFAGENRLFWEFSKFQVRALSGVTKAEADREFALVEEAMLNRRNRAWLPVITHAAAAGPLVVAFGALHLSGDQGVLNLLAQDGWTVASLTP